MTDRGSKLSEGREGEVEGSVGPRLWQSCWNRNTKWNELERKEMWVSEQGV